MSFLASVSSYLKLFSQATGPSPTLHFPDPHHFPSQQAATHFSSAEVNKEVFVK